jgi:hypothetical protein
MLPDTILRKLNKDEKKRRYYAAAYPDAKSRKPLLAWPWMSHLKMANRLVQPLPLNLRQEWFVKIIRN